MSRITVIGGGLAGVEAAWQLARRGVAVDLFEMRPGESSPAHKTESLAELVCSNSLRSDNPRNAVGLLHEELRRLGSLVMRCADEHRVPAGDALAVDRERFSAAVTAAVANCPAVRLRREQVCTLPPGPGLAIVATGPLTSDALASELDVVLGGRLYFYDSIAPIVAADSVDVSAVFAASRYGKGGDDYLNVPLSRAAYETFVGELVRADKVPPRAFEEPRYFEGCLPIEVLAERGRDALAFGPMKPVGLTDPRTGKRPHAVVQLRREDVDGTAYNLVGFQTRLTWPEQRRLFRTLPGLASAQFLRLGQVHRNTFIDSPRLLDRDLSLSPRPHLFFAGQLAGVEGYVESTACGLLAALAAAARLEGRTFEAPPATTALGALLRHVTGAAHPPGTPYQPTNVTFGLFPQLSTPAPQSERRARLTARARKDMTDWLADRSVGASTLAATAASHAQASP